MNATTRTDKMRCTAVAKHYREIIVLMLSLFVNTEPTFAQTDTTKTHDHSRMMEGMNMEEERSLSSNLSLNLPMSRDGSGTSWQPDESPMLMYSKRKGNTSLMVHGAFFLRYTSQDLTKQGNRGGSKFDAPNWTMFMLSQKLSAKDLLAGLSMLSLDRLTEGGKGYPLLLQSGESYNGVPLVDRQHPHDLFAELAVAYTHSFTKDLDLTSYFGYPGEPALGPVVFMHRISTSNNPDATLGHHWQDATHITFGVATLGLRYKIIKAEGSIFTGREPDESRYGFDKPRFDSYSYRLSANPDQNFSLQGTINFPDENLKRIYGNNPLAVEVFLKIAPASMMAHSTSTQ